MGIGNYDNGLRLFLQKRNLTSPFFYNSKRSYILIAKEQNEVNIVTIPINGIKQGLVILADLIASININDDIIVFGKNYNSKNKQFVKAKISETEILGFFKCAGFKLIANDEIAESKYYQFKRQEIKPIKHEKKSTFVKLERIGLKGEKITIYKVRTMYPYARYLHIDLINEFGYNENGKTRNDFRITKIGKFLRKYYLDEIPQLINLFRGDIQLVGCRPVSSKFLENYPEYIYNLRLLQKPGVISPAIADNAITVEEVIDSEYRFLLQLKKAPAATKRHVFIKAFWNVLSGKTKSQ